VILTVDQVVGRRITKVRAKREKINPVEKEVNNADE